MPFPSMRLEGMTALITGASGVLGTTAALAFAEAGADVALTARTLSRCEATAERVRALGRRAIALQADLLDPSEVKAMAAAAHEALGHIDILFNNAGITSPRSFLDTSNDEWLRVIDVNIKGTFLC